MHENIVRRNAALLGLVHESIRATCLGAAEDVVCGSIHHLSSIHHIRIGHSLNLSSSHSVGMFAHHIRQRPSGLLQVALHDLTAKKTFAQCLVWDFLDYGLAFAHVQRHVKYAVGVVATDDLAIDGLKCVLVPKLYFDLLVQVIIPNPVHQQVGRAHLWMPRIVNEDVWRHNIRESMHGMNS